MTGSRKFGVYDLIDVKPPYGIISTGKYSFETVVDI